MSALPGPKGEFFLGSLREFNRDTLKCLYKYRDFGDLMQFYFGPFPTNVVNHPDLVHDILVTQANKFYKARVTKQVLYPVIGDGLFTSDGEFWKHQRKLVQPVFHTKYIGNYAKIMADYAQDTADRWQDGSTYEIAHEMTNLTMRIISKTLFDADIEAESDEIGEAVVEVLKVVELRFKQLFPTPAWMPSTANRRMKQAIERLDMLIQQFIDERRKSGDDKGDLLSLLLAAADDDNRKMSDKQVRDEAMTLFGAGHETTATTMTWVWYLLSQHPEVEAKLHEELDRVLGGRLPTLADLPQLTYTEMIIKETQRLYPAAFLLTRQALEDVEVGGHSFKKDAFFLINILGIHHDARFFPDPERFDPERFSPENEKQIPKYAYLPFGGGPRICIGNAFALMEARLLLATIAQRYHLELAPGHQVEPERQFTLKPKYGLRMVVRERERIPAMG